MQSGVVTLNKNRHPGGILLRITMAPLLLPSTLCSTVKRLVESCMCSPQGFIINQSLTCVLEWFHLFEACLDFKFAF